MGSAAPLLEGVQGLNQKLLNRIRKLPQNRGYRAQLVACVFVILAITFALLWSPADPSNCKKPSEESKSSIHLVGLSLYFGLILVVAELLRRVCLLGEECRHLQTRYEDKKMILLHKVFGVELITTGTILLDIILVVILCYVQPTILDDIKKYLGLSSLLIAAYLFYFGIIRFNKTEVDLNVSLDQQQSMPAQGLACGYYVGYLKIVLSTVTKDDGTIESFSDRIDKFEKDANITLSSKKLHVIIPDSCEVGKTLEDMGLHLCKEKISVETVRAGRLCVYDVLVCKLDSDVYVMVDVPRTLATLKEMNDDGHLFYSLNPSQLIGQAQDFGRKLNDLLQRDEQCRTHFEIVHIKDNMSGTATTSSKPTLAKVIQNRLSTKSK